MNELLDRTGSARALLQTARAGRPFALIPGAISDVLDRSSTFRRRDHDDELDVARCELLGRICGRLRVAGAPENDLVVCLLEPGHDGECPLPTIAELGRVTAALREQTDPLERIMRRARFVADTVGIPLEGAMPAACSDGAALPADRPEDPRRAGPPPGEVV